MSTVRSRTGWDSAASGSPTWRATAYERRTSVRNASVRSSPRSMRSVLDERAEPLHRLDVLLDQLVDHLRRALDLVHRADDLPDREGGQLAGAGLVDPLERVGDEHELH